MAWLTAWKIRRASSSPEIALEAPDDLGHQGQSLQAGLEGLGMDFATGGGAPA